MLEIWVCESKHFVEGVAVDEFGEWTGARDRIDRLDSVIKVDQLKSSRIR